ncbi:MAG: sodium-dependent transporter [Nitrospira sp.]|nr:sodium-dependent transporter [Nitrospira sp.]MCY3954372.1 sodium-dependent transporter [Nitrospira sp.]MCY4131176.1 sodium-dependent transporter [Nitrospira sp.]
MPTHDKQPIHGQWSSRLAFIMAATGSAVGLGNIWKFPYITGENGGSAFVFVYLLCVAALGIPLMMTEVMLGRRGKRTPVNTMRVLAAEANANQGWQIIGWSGTVASVLILSYYSVIGGWTIGYILHAVNGDFSGLSGDGASSLFGDFIGNPLVQVGWHTAFMLITMFIVARGVRNGLEKAVTYLMPVLVVLLLVLVGYAMTTGYFMKGIAFLFTPDFSHFSGTSMLTALGHAFFTLSLGMGSIMIYGSYVPKGTSIASTSVAVAVADTLVALVAGMAIFPIVFANDLAPGAGPSLIFETLPVAFGHMTGGTFFGTLFFVLLLIAAWTSSISLVEPTVTMLIEKFNVTRRQAAFRTGLATWLLGFGTAFSFNLWSDVTVLGMTFFDHLDFLTSNLMLPLGAICMAIFAGWVMSKHMSREELNMNSETGYFIWQVSTRVIAPIAVSIVLLHAIGLF